ncbi:hypothetical protein FA95DRAFT_1487759 [Auriscalpium vulgare]|uniref:Uncharacterized protein n=1 Tax=Auriscalpium vulgare TaxID=40419 RepID=A0ACB8S1B5_9AGAM|nr:hypothetical protein FA95DRAFT_1487759 [Auriscalpium vulgare]
MTLLFRNLRNYGYIAVFLLSAAVLGISAYFASQFLPHLHHDFTIYSLIPPAWTIFIFLILLWNSTPRVEAFFLFISIVLWLTMAAWQTDIIGNTQCDSLGNSRVDTAKGTMSAKAYCDLSKVLEAFAWTTFVVLTLFFIFIIHLASKSVAMGRMFIWQENIYELPWFGQAPGYPGVSYAEYASRYGAGYGAYGGYPAGYGGQNVVQQLPGHSLVIQPGMNGMGPHVQQVPSQMM